MDPLSTSNRGPRATTVSASPRIGLCMDHGTIANRQSLWKGSVMLTPVMNTLNI